MCVPSPPSDDAPLYICIYKTCLYTNPHAVYPQAQETLAWPLEIVVFCSVAVTVLAVWVAGLFYSWWRQQPGNLGSQCCARMRYRTGSGRGFRFSVAELSGGFARSQQAGATELELKALQHSDSALYL